MAKMTKCLVTLLVDPEDYRINWYIDNDLILSKDFDKRLFESDLRAIWYDSEVGATFRLLWY